MKSNWSLPPSLSQRTWNVFEWIAIKTSANRFHSVPSTTKWKWQPWCLLSFNENGVASLGNASIKKNRMLHAQIQHRTNYLSSYRYNNSPESTLMNVHTNWRTLETTKCIQPAIEHFDRDINPQIYENENENRKWKKTKQKKRKMWKKASKMGKNCITNSLSGDGEERGRGYWWEWWAFQQSLWEIENVILKIRWHTYRLGPPGQYEPIHWTFRPPPGIRTYYTMKNNTIFTNYVFSCLRAISHWANHHQ